MSSNTVNNPYLKEYKFVEIRRYNPEYGDLRKCKCGHSYGRHFDFYEDDHAACCKYCGCEEFVEKTE